MSCHQPTSLAYCRKGFYDVTKRVLARRTPRRPVRYAWHIEPLCGAVEQVRCSQAASRPPQKNSVEGSVWQERYDAPLQMKRRSRRKETESLESSRAHHSKFQMARMQHKTCHMSCPCLVLLFSALITWSDSYRVQATSEAWGTFTSVSKNESSGKPFCDACSGEARPTPRRPVRYTRHFEPPCGAVVLARCSQQAHTWPHRIFHIFSAHFPLIFRFIFL